MFAGDHAATAVLITCRYPDVPLVPILVSVQAMELAWVALNHLGVERTTTDPVVLTTVVLAQILATPFAVGWAARRT